MRGNGFIFIISLFSTCFVIDFRKKDAVSVSTTFTRICFSRFLCFGFHDLTKTYTKF